MGAIPCPWLIGWTVPIPDPDPVKYNVELTSFLNVNKCAAQLFSDSSAEAFAFDWFGLITLRGALETDIHDLDDDDDPTPPEVYIPAAAAWISIAGTKLHSLDNEYEYGGHLGDPGGGGPLWDGQHGFCQGRWQLWRARFGQLSVEATLNDEVRQLAKQAEGRMQEIEGHT